MNEQMVDAGTSEREADEQSAALEKANQALAAQAQRAARNACVPAWQLQAVIDALIAKGVITQDDIDAAAAAASEGQG